MRRGKTGFLAFVIIFSLCYFLSYPQAKIFTFGETAVKLPAGSAVEIKSDVISIQIEEGRLEIILEPENLKVKAVDRTGKLVYSGNQGRVFSECQPEKFSQLKVTDADYRFIRFALGKPELDPAGRGVLIPKGTRIEKLENDLYRFHLENGETVSFKCRSTSEDKIGDCTRYTRDGRIMYTRTKVKLCRMTSTEELKSLPSQLSEDLWIQFVTESKS
ncbi:MAG: hypothetical protein QME85_07745 [Candidatus Saccharicenans sp.]|nr:hypothetical protein [Candidatus Saccharicenans sp.]MDI6850125.1 hypothetical protein [Candidatus Saccharicenans sp.]